MSPQTRSSISAKVSATLLALCALVIQGCTGSDVTQEEHLAATEITSTSRVDADVSITAPSDDGAPEEHPNATDTTSISRVDTDASITEQSDDGETVIIGDRPDDEDPANLLSVTGVVASVTGDLTATTEVIIITENGVTMSFIPAASASFHGGPVAHIRDHLITGEPVRIDYIETSNGLLRATYMEDADHDH